MDVYPTSPSSSTTANIISGIKSKNDDNGDGDDYRKQVKNENSAAKKKARSLALLKRQIRHHMNNAAPNRDPRELRKRDGRLLGHVSDTGRKGQQQIDNDVPDLDPREMQKRDGRLEDEAADIDLLEMPKIDGRKYKIHGYIWGGRKGRIVNGIMRNYPLKYQI